ncbi:MAG: DHHA1 domain-containing protein [Candidatus Omnitrophota bacterium]|nr:DHHA1 domain-containing protein [Candidatus Omnitrophota bacterium]
MEISTGRAALETLKMEAVRLKEENEQLEKQGKQLEKEIQQIKTQGAQAQARNVPAKEVGPFRVYFQKFSEPMGQAVLRSCIDVIQKADPQAVISIADSTGCIAAGTGATAQQQGISAKQLIEFWTALAGGSGGGRESMAQGQIENPELFSIQKFEQFIRERAK